MSDDIDRLKKALEDLRAVTDTLRDNGEAFRDVVAAVASIELETDPEGHGALRDLTMDICYAHLAFLDASRPIFVALVDLKKKARA